LGLGIRILRDEPVNLSKLNLENSPEIPNWQVFALFLYLTGFLQNFIKIYTTCIEFVAEM